MIVQIQTTSHCNGKCIICPYPTSWMVSHPGVMSDGLYTEILNSLANYMPLFQSKFCPYLMNEPFADKNIIGRISEAVDILFYPYIELSTNLVLPTTKQLDELIYLFKRNSYHGRIMVSHHGLTKATYEYTMKLPWGKALDNLKYLIKQAAGNIPIWIHTAGSSVDGKLTVEASHKAETFWRQWLLDQDLPVNNINIYSLSFHNRAGNVKLSNWTPPPQAYINCPRKDDLHVLWDGKVISCCCDYQASTILGDLSQQSVSDYFNSPEYKSWYNKLTGREEPPEDFLCKRCTQIGA